MADLSDVTAYLYQQTGLAVYPNGSTNPSIVPPAPGHATPMDVRIYEGWPLPEELELDILGKSLVGLPPQAQPRVNGPLANVSIFPLPGTGREVYQLLDKTYTLKAPVFGLTVGVSNVNQISITGAPTAGEFVTIVADRKFIFSAGGATAQDVLNQLLAQAQAKYAVATLSGSVLTVPAQYQLDVRQGGVGLLGKLTHRTCQFIMITVWAPNHQARNVLSKAIDTMLKNTIVATLPDGTDVKIVYNRTTVSDEQQNQSIYRRDLIYDCEYGALTTFPGTSITSVTIPTSITDGANVPANPTQATVVCAAN